jgi:pyrimidine operon attenuation protein/uracil phosphoribosyltransferase
VLNLKHNPTKFIHPFQEFHRIQSQELTVLEPTAQSVVLIAKVMFTGQDMHMIMDILWDTDTAGDVEGAVMVTEADIKKN